MLSRAGLDPRFGNLGRDRTEVRDDKPLHACSDNSRQSIISTHASVCLGSRIVARRLRTLQMLKQLNNGDYLQDLSLLCLLVVCSSCPRTHSDLSTFSVTVTSLPSSAIKICAPSLLQLEALLYMKQCWLCPS